MLTPGRHGWFKKLVLLSASLILSLGVAELLVRWFVPVRNVGPSFTIYDPVYGKRLKKSFRCWRTSPEFTMRFTTNSLGFRGPEPESPPNDVLLFVGDSFTMGYGVSDGQEYPALVAERLNDHFGPDVFPVINAGIGGNGNGRWIKFLRDEARRYKPRYVFLQVAGNDFNDNVAEHLFMRSKSGDLIEQPLPRPGFGRQMQFMIEALPGVPYSYVVGLLRQVRGAAHPRPRPERQAKPAHEMNSSSDKDQITFALIETALAICQKQNWPVAVLAVDLADRRLDELRLRCADSNNVPVLTVPLKQRRPDLYYEVDGHWNPRGHVLVADLLLKHLRTRLVVQNASRATLYDP